MTHVLLVEDDEADAFLLEEALERTQFSNTLHHAWDGEEAMVYLQDQKNDRPDLILLDLNMPRMNGHEVLKKIKHDDDLKDIPVGILTTSDSDDDINESYKNYASYYITKPTTADGLNEIVKVIDDFWLGTVKLPKHA